MNTAHFGRALVLAVSLGLVVSAVPATGALAGTVSATLSLVTSSHDGSAFDFNEYVDGDLTVQVTHWAKGNVDVDDARNLNYFWTVKPFGKSTAPIRVPATGTSTQSVDVAGKFVVPLPQGRASGSYTLSASISAGKSGSPAISGTTQALKVGNASTKFADASPLRTDPGTAHALTGALVLEDGTGLPGRLIDLGITRGTDGSDPEADAGLAAASGESLQDNLQVKTLSTGKFSALLVDPAEDGQGTEVGDVIVADTATTPGVGGNAAAATASLPVDFVTNRVLPVGATAILDPISGGTPGQAFASQLTITAPDDTFDIDPATPGVQGDAGTDRDPVEGQVYTISLDHGFFTSGHGPLPSVVGALAGDLDQLGTRLAGITGPDGLISFQVGMGRDKGFDDDGQVTATVTAAVGATKQANSAVWDSTIPLNGQVSVVLSSKGEQDNPVNPAVAGDLAYYDVLALDQFGNRAGKNLIDLTYTGDIENWDYSADSAVSDFTSSSDIWLTSFEPAKVTVTGTWEEAPTDLYVDTAGNSELGAAPASDSTSASFYDVNFGTSKFSITSSATDVVRVGTAVTQTVRVLDQVGNPVRGYEVQFFRYGPDKVSGNVLVSGTTNARGEVSYKFIGTKPGNAIVTAGITDGLRDRELKINVRFGAAIKAQLVAGKGGKGADRLTVSAPADAQGARVELYRVVSGTQTLAAVGKLSRTGEIKFSVKDRNGTATTSYIALVKSTSKTVADFSSTVKLR